MPIVAFGVLLFSQNDLYLLIFAVVALLGSFLGKGVNEPFGSLYQQLYNHVPGFFLFRDPTKWYVLTAVSYAMLIPKTLELVEKLFNKRIKRYSNFSMVFGFIFIIFWIFTLRLLFLGKVTGNISPVTLHKDYTTLTTILLTDKTPGRTLWLPLSEAFGYRSDLHPALDASTVFSESSPAGILRLLDHQSISNSAMMGVSYLIIPIDIQHRIFLDDYVYHQQLRDELISKLDYQTGLKRIKGFSELAVYKVGEVSPIFSIDSQPISVNNLSYDRWSVTLPSHVSNSYLKTLIAFDPNWRFVTANFSQKPLLYKGKFMEFKIPENSSTNGILVYLPTQLARYGAVVSGASIVTCALLLFFSRRKKV